MTQSFTVVLPRLNFAAVADNLTFNFVLNNIKLNKIILALAEIWIKVIPMLSVD